MLTVLMSLVVPCNDQPVSLGCIRYHCRGHHSARVSLATVMCSHSHPCEEKNMDVNVVWNLDNGGFLFG